MRHLRSCAMLLLAVLVLSSCTTAHPSLEHGARETLRRAALAYAAAITAHDAAAVARFYRDDVISISPQSREPVIGPEANHVAWAGFFSRPKAEHRTTLEDVIVDATGSLGYTFGDWTAAVEVDGKVMAGAGRYVLVWRRSGDSWKIAVVAAHRTG